MLHSNGTELFFVTVPNAVSLEQDVVGLTNSQLGLNFYPEKLGSQTPRRALALAAIGG